MHCIHSGVHQDVRKVESVIDPGWIQIRHPPHQDPPQQALSDLLAPALRQVH